jgi:hypothetical protein
MGKEIRVECPNCGHGFRAAAAGDSGGGPGGELTCPACGESFVHASPEVEPMPRSALDSPGLWAIGSVIALLFFAWIASRVLLDIRQEYGAWDRLERSGVAAEGVVVETGRSKGPLYEVWAGHYGEGGAHRHITYSFDDDGQSIERSEFVSTALYRRYKNAPPGAAIEIVYLADDPEVMRIAGNYFHRNFALTFLGFCGANLLIGLFVFVMSFSDCVRREAPCTSLLENRLFTTVVFGNMFGMLFGFVLIWLDLALSITLLGGRVGGGMVGLVVAYGIGMGFSWLAWRHSTVFRRWPSRL